MPSLQDELTAQLASIGDELNRRQRVEEKLNRYYEGGAPIPEAIVRARVTKTYRMLMGMAEAPWGSLIVDSVQDRLEVTGIDSPDGKEVTDRLWDVWQENGMDAESKLAHNAALTAGRAFAGIWPDDEMDSGVGITLDTASCMCVQYAPGSRRKRVAAMRWWVEGNKPYANLYRPDGIYKFIGPKNSTGIQGIQWSPRSENNEQWPLENPFGVVPVVELPVNRRLKSTQFGYARGEYEHVTALIDRINLLTFLGLVVAFWQGFPLRGVVGEKIRREVLVDDNGDPIISETTGREATVARPPFDVNADELFQLENPDAKLVSYQPADRTNLSIYAELDQLSSICKTPRHYMPMQGGMANLSADAIRASEGGLIAKIPNHKSSLGEGHEDTLRVAGMMLPDNPFRLSQRAELRWADHESRSLAERADAAVKLANILPNTAIIEYVLNASSEQMARWQADSAGDAISLLLRSAATPVTAPVQPTVPVIANGNGNGNGAAA